MWWSITALWLTFALVHLLLAWVGLVQAQQPFNDVSRVYRLWLDAAAEAGGLPGTVTEFVYPPAAAWPMWLTDALGGHDRYLDAWLWIVFALNALALARLTLIGRSGPGWRLRVRAGWWWCAFLGLLGPVALGRIDSITVPIALLAVLELRRFPAVAGALMTLAAWMKIWPGGLLLAALATGRHWRRLAAGAVAATAIVIAVSFSLGGTLENFLSFVTGQNGRGLQLESTGASLLLALKAVGVGGYSVVFDREIVTQQIWGPGAEAINAAVTPLMFLVVVALMGLAIRARRRGAGMAQVFPALALAIIVTMIVVNKVGSPQFVTWIVPAIVIGLIWDGRAFAVPAGLGLAISALTQWIYPWYYWEITAASPAGAAVLLARNLLLIGLLVWAGRRLWRAVPAGLRRPNAVRAGTRRGRTGTPAPPHDHR